MSNSPKNQPALTANWDQVSYLDKLQVGESAHAEVWGVLEGGARDLSDAPAHGATFRSALGAAQRRRAVEVAPVGRRTELWG